MAIDICKILHNQGISVRPTSVSIAKGLQKAVASDSKKLMQDTYQAITHDMGIGEIHPELTVFSKKPNLFCIDLGDFDMRTANTKINDWRLVHSKKPEEFFKHYLDLGETIYHESRHFVQNLFIIKDKGFDRFLEKYAWVPPEMNVFKGKILQNMLEKSYRKDFYESAATQIPPLTAEQKKIASDILDSKGYNAFEVSAFGVNDDYKKDPKEIDAKAFASKKIQEVSASIKQNFGTWGEITNLFGDVFSKKSA